MRQRKAGPKRSKERVPSLRSQAITQRLRRSELRFLPCLMREWLDVVMQLARTITVCAVGIAIMCSLLLGKSVVNPLVLPLAVRSLLKSDTRATSRAAKVPPRPA